MWDAVEKKRRAHLAMRHAHHWARLAHRGHDADDRRWKHAVALSFFYKSHNLWKR